MDKKLIEQIALEVAKEVTPEFIWEEGCNHECGVCKHELYEFAAKFLARIDAERGKDAVALLHSDGYWTIAKSASPDLRERLKTFGCRVPVFLSPTIPGGMALVPELSTSAMDIAGMEAVGIEGFGKAEAELCYIAMLAAAQGERNAD